VLDLHCHILPGVDDGAIDLPDALDMARDALAQGCRAVCATSHFGESLFETTPRLLRDEHRRLVAALAGDGVALNVFPGAENFLSEDDAGAFAERAIPLGESGRWVLFDFSMREPPRCVGAVIEALRARGRGSVIAHPERNLALMDDPTPIAEWIARGALMQVNAASLVGLLGKDAQEMAEHLLERGAAHVLASDAHDRRKRPFCLADGRKAAEAIVGADEARRLCDDRPWSVVRGEPVPVTVPSLAPRSRGARLLRKLRDLGS
jgi:protein-tyrosine phosphatase